MGKQKSKMIELCVVGENFTKYVGFKFKGIPQQNDRILIEASQETPFEGIYQVTHKEWVEVRGKIKLKTICVVKI